MKGILSFLLVHEEGDENKVASTLWTTTIMCLCSLEQNKGKALKNLIELQSVLKKKGLNKMMGSLL